LQTRQQHDEAQTTFADLNSKIAQVKRKLDDMNASLFDNPLLQGKLQEINARFEII
jgi:hypothetical protein